MTDNDACKNTYIQTLCVVSFILKCCQEVQCPHGKYCLDGQICNSTMEFLAREGIAISGQEFYCIVDHLLVKRGSTTPTLIKT